MSRILLVSLALGALAACNPSGGIPEGATETVTDCLVLHRDPLTIDSARVEQDFLWLDVSYGGGCRTHTVYTCWNTFFENDDGDFNEANPPRVEIQIGHDADNDSCEAIEQQTAGFSLAEVKQTYLDTHDNPGNRLVLVLDGTTVQYPIE